MEENKICNNKKCINQALYKCLIYPFHELVFCSKACQLIHVKTLINDSIKSSTSGIVTFSPQLLNKERVSELVTLLGETTNEANTIKAVDLFSKWFKLPQRLRVVFFDSKDIIQNNVIIATSANNISIDGRLVELEGLQTKIGSIRNAATDGKFILINRNITTVEFQKESLRFIRFPIPEGIPHYTAIMFHEFGHAIHINKSTRNILDSLWLDWIKSKNGKMPEPGSFTEFVEEIADRFAISMFEVLKN